MEHRCGNMSQDPAAAQPCPWDRETHSRNSATESGCPELRLEVAALTLESFSKLGKCEFPILPEMERWRLSLCKCLCHLKEQLLAAVTLFDLGKVMMEVRCTGLPTAIVSF